MTVAKAIANKPAVRDLVSRLRARAACVKHADARLLREAADVLEREAGIFHRRPPRPAIPKLPLAPEQET